MVIFNVLQIKGEAIKNIYSNDLSPIAICNSKALETTYSKVLSVFCCINLLILISVATIVNRNKSGTKIIPFFKDILIHILNQEIWNDFEFEFDYDYSLVNQSIMIEQFLITKVIHNIIYNSVLHNEKGCTIRINLFKKDTNVIVEIKDNGQGASPEKIAELNELSFKNIDISKIRTTGIGLKISKQIVDLHQGSISFASVQTEFFESIISLPIFNITN